MAANKRIPFYDNLKIKLMTLFSLLKIVVIGMALFLSVSLTGQVNDHEFIAKLLNQNKEKLQGVVENPEKYKLQIVYTQIDRNKKNQPSFTTYSYRADKNEYFYPASTVKIFAAALALEKLNNLNIKGLDKYSIMLTDSSYSGQSRVFTDSTAPNLKPSIAHYIRKIFVVSDNDAFNRLYEFIGQEDFNTKLYEKGFHDLYISHRLSIALTPEENKHTNRINFYTAQEEDPVYSQAPQKSSKNYLSKTPITLGKGYFNETEVVETPMDFSNKNNVPITELHQIIKILLFPESVDEKQRFNLTPEDYAFLRQYLSQLPRETKYPSYDNEKYPDNYCKFFIYGDKKEAQIPYSVRIFNKIGNAYGFVIDNAYIVDFENNIEFMLSAVVYANENNILNDGNYEYDTLAYPVMANIGRIFYDYELQRKRKNKPDLSTFKMNYDQ